MCEESWKDARGEVNKEVDIGMTYWYPAVCGFSGRPRMRCFTFHRRGETPHNDVWTECDLSWGLQRRSKDGDHSTKFGLKVRRIKQSMTLDIAPCK